MRTIILKLVGLLTIICLPVIEAWSRPDGGNYILSPAAIGYGGGRSTGVQYVLTGTIGQPDAGQSEGGEYKLLGGFWPGGPLCFVDLEEFALFAEYWLETGAGLPADLDGDEDVDIYDLRLFVYQWLCECPYNWQLK